MWILCAINEIRAKNCSPISSHLNSGNQLFAEVVLRCFFFSSLLEIAQAHVCVKLVFNIFEWIWFVRFIFIVGRTIIMIDK